MTAPLSPEREQYAAWKAQAKAEFLAQHPKASNLDANDAAEAFAGLMLHRAKRMGLFDKAAAQLSNPITKHIGKEAA